MTTPGNKEFIDYYALLNIATTADSLQIRRAYIVQAKEHHPDAGGDAGTMLLLNRAYKTLMNPSAKAAYDLLHSFNDGSTKPSDYAYHGDKGVDDVSDMADEEIDSFLDSLLSEYRNGIPEPKMSIKQKIRRLWDI